MTIPFVKAHGAGNDFLLTWEDRAPKHNLPEVARAICHRHLGVGADGWILARPDAIQLFNSDGSDAELSGNGTRCAAAMLVDAGLAKEEITLTTGAGLRHLRLISRRNRTFEFEMDMGLPVYQPDQIRHPLQLTGGVREVTILNVGNPQCAVFVDQIPTHWAMLGAEIEAHPYFPRRSNVSFVRVVDPHTIEVRFFERGAGVTLSSGTGSSGAAEAAILRGLVQSPVKIQTQAGDLQLRWDDSVYLTGPAEITAAGEFYLP